MQAQQNRTQAIGDCQRVSQSMCAALRRLLRLVRLWDSWRRVFLSHLHNSSYLRK
jgi:hypothetical protein